MINTRKKLQKILMYRGHQVTLNETGSLRSCNVKYFCNMLKYSLHAGLNSLKMIKVHFTYKKYLLICSSGTSSLVICLFKFVLLVCWFVLKLSGPLCGCRCRAPH